jgi:hypothetical protein
VLAIAAIPNVPGARAPRGPARSPCTAMASIAATPNVPGWRAPGKGCWLARTAMASSAATPNVPGARAPRGPARSPCTAMASIAATPNVPGGRAPGKGCWLARTAMASSAATPNVPGTRAPDWCRHSKKIRDDFYLSISISSRFSSRGRRIDHPSKHSAPGHDNGIYTPTSQGSPETPRQHRTCLKCENLVPIAPLSMATEKR